MKHHVKWQRHSLESVSSNNVRVNFTLNFKKLKVSNERKVFFILEFLSEVAQQFETKTSASTCKLTEPSLLHHCYGGYNSVLILMGSHHRQVVILVPDEKLNCFYFWQAIFFKAKRDSFYPGPVEPPSGWWLPITLPHCAGSSECETLAVYA